MDADQHSHLLVLIGYGEIPRLSNNELSSRSPTSTIHKTDVTKELFLKLETISNVTTSEVS